MKTKDPSGIERQLHYEFKNKPLLQEALRHSSYVNELADAQLRDNERLEFLGDAVLNLIIGHLLMQFYPNLKEGDLSKNRASLVNESRLADIARNFDLGAYLQLGKGEIQTNGRQKNSILADAFEALIAAVYLDGGFEGAFQIIKACFSPLIEHLHTATDAKSRLQEQVQVKHGVIPTYTVIREEGPDHDKTFWVRLTVLEIETEAAGKSKKAAEQQAALKALELLENRSP